mgnify:CR=1 FL=1
MQDRKKGILYILGAAFGFSLMSLFVRLSGDVPTYEKVVEMLWQRCFLFSCF